MYRFKNRLFKSFFLVVLLVSFVSCSSFNFKKSAGNLEKNNTEQKKISGLESELTTIKQDQAHLELQMKNKDTDISKLQDTVSKLEKKISVLEKNKTALKPVQKQKKFTKPSVLYKKARNLLVEENYTDAAALFKQFIKDYPQNSLADNAVYWLGECHYSSGDYKKAILVFQDLETKYPKSEKIPDAILKLGFSYLSLDDSNRAHHYLKKVLKKYPFSPAAEKAQEKLRSFE